MSQSSENKKWNQLRSKILGLGEHSMRKSYYPELQSRIEELERFRSLIDQMNDLVLIGNLPNGEIFYANYSASRILLNRSFLDGEEHLLDILGAGLFNKMIAAYEQRQNNKSLQGFYSLSLDYEFNENHFEVSINFNELAGLSYFTAIFRNITKRFKVEEELLTHRNHLEDLVSERTAELKKTNKDLARFNELFIGREFRIKELKLLVEELNAKVKLLENDKK